MITCPLERCVTKVRTGGELVHHLTEAHEYTTDMMLGLIFNHLFYETPRSQFKDLFEEMADNETDTPT